MSFSEAADLFLGSTATLNAKGRIQYVAPRTHKDQAFFLKTLEKFFGQIKLRDIHAGHLKVYQEARATGDGFTRQRKKNGPVVPSIANAAKINDELGVLRRLMVAAGCWTPTLQALYMPLQELERDIPKALSEAEEQRFLDCAAAMPECRVVWWYSLVARHTIFSSDEMRTIRQGDINLSQGILGVNRRYGKNNYRRRDVPLYDGECIWALEQLLARSQDLVGSGPHLFLFPKRVVKDHYDGERPMGDTGLRRAFHMARAAAGVEWFCINGWRHTAITRRAEAGVPIALIMKRAGHSSPKMTEHYTHICEQVAWKEEQARMGLGRKPPTNIMVGYQKRRA